MKFIKKIKDVKIKITAIMTAIALCIGMSAGSVKVIADEISSSNENTTMTGDINGDNRINSLDLSKLKQGILYNQTLSMDTADTNGDGLIDVNDVNELQDYILGRISGFSGDIKKAFNSVDRTLVTKTVTGDDISACETQITAEMAELAQNLGTAQEIYNYVLNNVNTEFYYGSRKGAIGTYEQNGGNDFDQASLLIAMLRYQGYTANYASADIVISDDDLLNMTAASDVSAAKRIFTSQARTLEDYSTGKYKTSQTFVSFETNDGTFFLDPSFKYYKLKEDAVDFKSIMDTLDTEYDLTGEGLDIKDISSQIEGAYGNQPINEIFPMYEIVKQDSTGGLPYEVVSDEATCFSIVPPEKSDAIQLYLGDSKIFSLRSAYLYSKNLTIEYELTEDALAYLNAYDYNIDSIDDLTVDLRPYSNLAQIYPVIKLDGEKVANGSSNLLGSKETMHINIRSAGKTLDFEKELTYGGLYSIVFDYQNISPQDIAASYAKLPQKSEDQMQTTENNVFGSKFLMDTLSLLGKSYFSQIDTNNALYSEMSDVDYSRSLSVAVVDFTPDIYTQYGSTKLNKQGKISIDVIGNQTSFISHENNSTEESKIKQSTGYLSSYYESEVIKQFTGFQAVSTAEVLSRSAEQGIDILYLSSANSSELDASTLSTQNKTDIAALLNEGKYVTVPNSEISIDNWSGTGYIVYDPETDSSSYIINNNLNGGSLCSWVGLAYLSDILISVVECTWAFDMIMLGATIFAAGVIMLTGPIGWAALAVTAAGLGITIAGTFYVKNIGDRLYNSTELMNQYVAGDTAAGEQLKLNAAVHVGGVSLFYGFFKSVSVIANKVGKPFAETLLGKKAGTFFANAFKNTPGGCEQALEILNRISLKYSNIITSIVDNYGNELANNISNEYESNGIKGVEEIIENIDNGVAEYGDSLGRMGTYVESPNLKVDWTLYAEHGTEQMVTREITKEMVNYYVDNGKALLQSNGDKFAFVTKEGVAVVSKEGKLITTWSSDNFDDAMLWIIKKLFGE